MVTEFRRNGINYKLLVTFSGMRDLDNIEITPDKSLWTSRQKHQALTHQIDTAEERLAYSKAQSKRRRRAWQRPQVAANHTIPREAA